VRNRIAGILRELRALAVKTDLNEVLRANPHCETVEGLPSLASRCFLSRYMTPDEIQSLIEEATFDHATGESDSALAKLARAAAADPESFDAWHAMAEINFALRRFDAALAAAERAHALRPDDLFINTTLSRAWMELGDKAKAEHFGAQAKIQSWKAELKKGPADNPKP
jgi:Flp pilus assembly protein TadD